MTLDLRDGYHHHVHGVRAAWSATRKRLANPSARASIRSTGAACPGRKPFP